MAEIGSRGVDLQEGEAITLFASAARTVTAGVNGTAVYIGGQRQAYIFVLRVTAAAVAADDELDVYIDWSFDDTTYFNGAHFTPVLGNGGAVSYYTAFVPVGITADVALTADAADSTTRPSTFGPYVRGRYIITDPDTDASFTFSLTGYAL
jgi:hypothetical protein